MINQIKTQLAKWIVQSVSEDKDLGEWSLNVDLLVDVLEKPKNSNYGQLALPLFRWSKTLKKRPDEIAAQIQDKLQSVQPDWIQAIVAKGGFVNFDFSSQFLTQSLYQPIISQADHLGYQQVGVGKKVVIDFSSPNVAKPMSVGHLRATVIGQAIVNLGRSQGYEVIGLNHLGDWGVQFGKLAWAFKNWGSDYDFEKKPFESLYALYVRFHEEAEQNPGLNEEGSKTFRLLEQGDPEVHKLWKHFVEISLEEYQRLWDLLGVKHDLVRGESFYNDRLKSVEAELEAKGLLVESENAMVVHLSDPKMPPCLIRKSDGASLYATRDIASAIYRMKELGCDLNLNVVGVDQTLHFKQVFEVLSKMGYSWSEHCHHIAFGMYKFKDIGKMSTRKGNVIFLEDVVRRSIELVKNLIEEKNPQLENKDLVAKQVGVGAIIFNDLINDRVKNVDFDWDRVLDFEGDSGPYVQYMAVRCRSLIEKYGKPVHLKQNELLNTLEEKELLFQLNWFEQVLSVAWQQYKPHFVANYLLELCRAFSRFYAQCPILKLSDPDLIEARMGLVLASERVIVQGLRVLNIETPTAM